MVSQPKGAIVSPTVDFLCCGGLSIVAVIGIFVYAFISPESELFRRGVSIREMLILGTLINAPHFMASYRLLYSDRAQIFQHRWASSYVPLILLVVVGYALVTPSPDPETAEFANGTVVEVLLIFSVRRIQI